MRSVFISGASSGIGRVAAQQLAADGWRVFAAALPDADLAALAAATPGRLVPLPLDITDAAAVQAAADDIRRQVGHEGLHGIVNNAGIQVPGPLETLSVAALKRQFDVNLFGHVQVLQALLPLLRATGGGRIVNVSSLMGQVAMPVLGAYSMSKHALEALSDVLRLELAAWQIHVAVIEPGAIATPMTDDMGRLLEQSQAAAPEAVRGLYARLYAGMAQALRAQARQALPPEVIAACIVHALTARRPKTRYAPGAAVQGLLLLRRLAPDTVRDAILKRALGL
ncbi:MAG: SDR family NAD(P)-dependent oxidoreductase [Anaerolineae bacterium]|jgi:NAD(P)-dependent dehydrogenase (short-subunit alcohol dehydrogenase family)|nr:SDR family NAD(P)-dependent oxidoreductase [Anaerolineae bacterium]